MTTDAQTLSLCNTTSTSLLEIVSTQSLRRGCFKVVNQPVSWVLTWYASEYDDVNVKSFTHVFLSIVLWDYLCLLVDRKWIRVLTPCFAVAWISCVRHLNKSNHAVGIGNTVLSYCVSKVEQVWTSKAQRCGALVGGVSSTSSHDLYQIQIALTQIAHQISDAILNPFCYVSSLKRYRMFCLSASTWTTTKVVPRQRNAEWE